MSRDPVCGQEVDALRARAVGIWGGRTYYFCSADHKAEFARDPAAFGEHGPRMPTEQIPVRAPTPAPRAPSALAPVTPIGSARARAREEAAAKAAPPPVEPARNAVEPAAAPAMLEARHPADHDDLDEEMAPRRNAGPPALSVIVAILVALALLAAGALLVLRR